MATLVEAGFNDFSTNCISFVKTGVATKTWIPFFYSVAMVVSEMRSFVGCSSRERVLLTYQSTSMRETAKLSEIARFGNTAQRFKFLLRSCGEASTS